MQMRQTLRIPLKGIPILGFRLHSDFDFIGIVAIFIFGDCALDVGVNPIPEITIFPPWMFPAHPGAGKHAGRIKSFIGNG